MKKEKPVGQEGKEEQEDEGGEHQENTIGIPMALVASTIMRWSWKSRLGGVGRNKEEQGGSRLRKEEQEGARRRKEEQTGVG